MSHTTVPQVIAIRRLDTEALRALARAAGLGGAAMRTTKSADLAARARPRGGVRIEVPGVPPMRARLGALLTTPQDVRRLALEMIAEYERRNAALGATEVTADDVLATSEGLRGRRRLATLLMIGVALAFAMLLRP